MMPDAGLRTDQAPPLSVPASFFLTTPVAMFTAGVLLLVAPAALASRWSGPAIALAHLGTLGMLGATMLGALYQLIPVVAGRPVPYVRLAHLVHALFVAGLVSMTARFLGAGSDWAWLGMGALSAAFLLFLGPVAYALVRAPAPGWTPRGMRLAGVALMFVVALGIRSLFGHAGASFPDDRALWTQVHLSLGLIAWVGGLVAAAGWQLVPMFYLAPPFDVRVQHAVHGLQALGMVLLVALLAVSAAGVPVGPRAALLAAAPAALGVWGIAPVAVAIGLRRRRRARPDGSVRFWVAALPVAMGLPILGTAAVLSDDPRWGVLFGWMAIWGWAGAIVHGMLTRIVAFLAWFHHFSPLLGKVVVPPMRALYPDARVRLGFWLHLGTTLAGVVAIGTGVTWPAAMGLVATGTWLGWHLLAALRRTVVPLSTQF